MQSCVALPQKLTLTWPGGEGQGSEEVEARVHSAELLPLGTLLSTEEGLTRLQWLREALDDVPESDVRRQFGCDDIVEVVQGRHVRRCSWLRFVATTPVPSAANVIVVRLQGHSVIVVCEDLQPDTALVAYLHTGQQPVTDAQLSLLNAVDRALQFASGSHAGDLPKPEFRLLLVSAQALLLTSKSRARSLTSSPTPSSDTASVGTSVSPVTSLSDVSQAEGALSGSLHAWFSPKKEKSDDADKTMSARLSIAPCSKDNRVSSSMSHESEDDDSNDKTEEGPLLRSSENLNTTGFLLHDYQGHSNVSPVHRATSLGIDSGGDDEDGGDPGRSTATQRRSLKRSSPSRHQQSEAASSSRKYLRLEGTLSDGGTVPPALSSDATMNSGAGSLREAADVLGDVKRESRVLSSHEENKSRLTGKTCKTVVIKVEAVETVVREQVPSGDEMEHTEGDTGFFSDSKRGSDSSRSVDTSSASTPPSYQERQPWQPHPSGERIPPVVESAVSPTRPSRTPDETSPAGRPSSPPLTSPRRPSAFVSLDPRLARQPLFLPTPASVAEPQGASPLRIRETPGIVRDEERSTEGRRVKKWWPCERCPKRFDRPSLLTRHLRTHTGEKPAVCDVCQKGFSTVSSLNTHRRIHMGEKPCKCPVCGKRFTASSNLHYHKMTHDKEKPHKCSQCPRTFSTPGDLRAHMCVHTNVWPYLCGKCGKGFSKKTPFANHMAKHGEVAQHACATCGKSFNQLSQLTYHAKTHEERPFMCPRCKKPLPTSEKTSGPGVCPGCSPTSSPPPDPATLRTSDKEDSGNQDRVLIQPQKTEADKVQQLQQQRQMQPTDFSIRRLTSQDTHPRKHRPALVESRLCFRRSLSPSPQRVKESTSPVSEEVSGRSTEGTPGKSPEPSLAVSDPYAAPYPFYANPFAGFLAAKPWLLPGSPIPAASSPSPTSQFASSVTSYAYFSPFLGGSTSTPVPGFALPPPPPFPREVLSGAAYFLPQAAHAQGLYPFTPPAGLSLQQPFTPPGAWPLGMPAAGPGGLLVGSQPGSPVGIWPRLSGLQPRDWLHRPGQDSQPAKATHK